MPKKRCSWGTCKSDSRYPDKEYMKEVDFIPFPKPKTNLEKCKLWVKLCGRPHDQLNVNKVNRYTYICSKHFEDGWPTTENPNPMPADPYDQRKGTPKGRKRPAQRSPLPTKVKFPKKLVNESPLSLQDQRGTTEVPDGHLCINEPSDKVTGDSAEHQDCSVKCTSCGSGIETSPTTRKKLTRNDFINQILTDNDHCYRYTGFSNVALLKSVFEWLEPTAAKMSLWDGARTLATTKKRHRKRGKLTLLEEFVLTLVRVKRGYDSHHLSFIFGVSQSHVSRIFTTWINFLAKVFKPLLRWPSKEVVTENLPDSFRAYPRTRCIIDCTEFKVEKPFRPAAQKLTWSNYKHANTFKALVGIMPSGAFTFISKLYPGSVSDAAIVKLSGFLDKIEEGDDIMADRGFNIRHLLLPKKATLNMPAFSHGKSLGFSAVKRSRNIASVRIHVERAIGRMKTFKLLSGVLPIKMRYLINQIITVVAVICNLQKRLA